MTEKTEDGVSTFDTIKLILACAAAGLVISYLRQVQGFTLSMV